MKNLLQNLDGETLNFNGKTFSTEEAASVWSTMTDAERALYTASTDAETAYNIYASEIFGYYQK